MIEILFNSSLLRAMRFSGSLMAFSWQRGLAVKAYNDHAQLARLRNTALDTRRLRCIERDAA